MASGSGNSEEHVGFRVDEELLEQFMLAYRKAQSDGHAPVDGDRSQAFRQLMKAFINNPEIIKYGSQPEDE